jgi:predicted nucleic acid-binding protein
MCDDFILNASPMILLGKADLLKTISPLAKSWIIPKGVVREVEKKRSLIGSIGLIILAKRKGLIDLAKPKIESLKAAGLYIDATMLDRIYTRIGE